MQLIRNKKGMSLPEIMVALGLMGGVSLVTMKLVQTSQGNEAFIKANGEISKTMGVIQNALNNPDNCRSMIGGYDLDGAALPFLRMRVMNRSTNTIDTVNLLTASTQYPGFYLQNDSIKLVTNTTFQTGTVTDVVLKFKIKQLSTSQWGSSITEQANDKTIEKRIPVYVKTNGATVVSCGPVIGDTNIQAREKFCQSLAGGSVTQWTTDGRCVLKSMDCPVGKIPKSMGKMGEFTCEDITTAVPATQIFNTDEPPCNIGVGGIKIISDGNGRLKIQCN